MNAGAPIEINFYTDADEIEQTFSRTRIPSYLLDMAIHLQAELNAKNDQQNTDLLFDFIVEFFGGRFSRDELKKKSDLLECMTVVRSIIARASQLTLDFAKANPPGPSPKKK